MLGSLKVDANRGRDQKAPFATAGGARRRSLFFYLAIECENPSAANRFFDALEAAYNRLAGHPEIGSRQDVENPLLEGVRMWPVPGFEDRLIYYIPRDDLIDVIRVLGRRSAIRHSSRRSR